ncbi:MAG: hypothetical protein DRJ68_00955 [Thermoprotei archaeon]|nr:MAG: hypothetical protein DRJ68_00955 [Thermoprotei archaeon]
MDFVIKIGGSMYGHVEGLRALCRCLSSWLKGRSCLVTPGGGPFADAVRLAQKAYGFSDDVAHEMALLAVDQYGLMLSDLIEGSIAVRSIADAKRFVHAFIPIILPSCIVNSLDMLEHSWRAASDCIAAAIAKACNAKKLVLVKDVDGVYLSLKDKRLLRRLSPEDLKLLGDTCLDPLLPELLSEFKLRCVVVNGLNLEAVKMVIEDRELEATCTVIG